MWDGKNTALTLKIFGINKNNKEKNQEIIISLSNTISLLSSNLYEKSIKNQIFASIILFMTILLAVFLF